MVGPMSVAEWARDFERRAAASTRQFWHCFSVQAQRGTLFAAVKAKHGCEGPDETRIRLIRESADPIWQHETVAFRGKFSIDLSRARLRLRDRPIYWDR